MTKDPGDNSVREVRAAYMNTLTDVVHMQLDIPRDVWIRLTQWASERQMEESEAVVQIIKHRVTRPEDTYMTGFYADLVGQHLRGELEPGPCLSDIKVDEHTAAAIRQELENEYGTDDPVKIVELARNRE
jgi:hypothetical protein